MIRRPPRSTRVRSSAASDVYKRQVEVHPLPKEVLVGGRLQKYSKLWSTITRDRWVLRTVRDGISLGLIDNPQFNEPFDSAHSLTGRPAQLQACQETVQSYLAKDIIEPVLDNSPGLYAAFFGVPKKDSQELRGCWDGRALNEYIRYEHFKICLLYTSPSPRD